MKKAKIFLAFVVLLLAIASVKAVTIYCTTSSKIHVPKEVDKIVVVQDMMPFSKEPEIIVIKDKEKVEKIVAIFNHTRSFLNKAGGVMDGNRRTFKFYHQGKLVKTIFMAEEYLENEVWTNIDKKRLNHYVYD